MSGLDCSSAPEIIANKSLLNLRQIRDNLKSHYFSLMNIYFKCLDGAAPIEKTNNAQTLIPGIKAPGTT